MKRIVLFAITMLVVAVSMHAALSYAKVSGVPQVAITSVTAAAVALIAILCLFGHLTEKVGEANESRALGIASTAAFVALAGVSGSLGMVGVPFSIAIVSVTAYAASGIEHVPYRWALAAYGFEALAVGGALTIARASWGTAIVAIMGIVALLSLLALAPHPVPISTTPQEEQ